MNSFNNFSMPNLAVQIYQEAYAGLVFCIAVAWRYMESPVEKALPLPVVYRLGLQPAGQSKKDLCAVENFLEDKREQTS